MTNLILNNVILPIAQIILVCLAGYIGLEIKKLYTKHLESYVKKDTVNICVKAVEQLYKNLHGQEKYNECAQIVANELNKKGIAIDEDELKCLIESAVQEFNKSIK